MKRGVVIQARMGATRLPGKPLMEIGHETMLSLVVKRARRARAADLTVVATGASPRDEVIVEHARTLGVETFCGDEEDVLHRYYGAAKAFGLDVIVRITADCPLIEPNIIDKVVTAFTDALPAVDFAANTLRRTYPQGLDVEVASFAALKRAWQEADKPYQRAHVFPYIYEHPDQFNLIGVADECDRSWMRWTVDMKEDLDFVRVVYHKLGDDDMFSWKDVLSLLEREPELLEINRHIRQKALMEG
jgi:spore coat polysaccharide biosynthesis protein SpsF